MRHIVIVIPVYNEAGHIVASLQAILASAAAVEERQGVRLSVLVVDDGSRDGVAELLGRHAELGTRLHLLRFTRNYGKEAAIAAGLNAAADADAVIVMDSDLQHPPALLEPMVEAWLQGSLVVEANKRQRNDGEPLVRGWAASLFYWLFARSTGLALRQQSDFKLLDAQVVHSYLALPERSRFFRGLIDWLRYPSTRLEFDVPAGSRSGSQWGLWGLCRYALRSLTSFTTAPLYLVALCGLMTLLLSLVFGGIALFDKISGRAVDGFSTVILLLLIIGSILMFSLGMIGVYVARIYEEVKRRPLYVVDERGSRLTGLPRRSLG